MQPITACVLILLIYSYLLAALAAHESTALSLPDLGSLFFVILVPALNEETVIGRTLISLLELEDPLLILVVDDASDDGTVASVTPFLDDGRVRIVSQPKDQARRGKGAALNAGYAEVWRLGVAERFGPDNIIIGVFDADAQVKPDFLRTVSRYFHDPTVAGVQSTVRMYNAQQNLLTLWQHLEFAIWGSIFCRAKNGLRTATLGGNGQCVRLSALASLGAEPWKPSSLTEDLDLSLRLLLKGWHMCFCPSAAVWQEAVPRFRRLVRQRSRWMQGHFVCWEYLPALLRSQLPAYARLDLSIYLLLPVAILPIGLASLAAWVQFWKHFGNWTAGGFAVWYVLGFWMVPLMVVVLRQVEHTSRPRSIIHAHLFIFYSLIWLVACVVAFKNVLLGRRAWAKTTRSIVVTASAPIAGQRPSGD
jgi:1,2-diacylglycerol 3-beta-glucosyltransferase